MTLVVAKIIISILTVVLLAEISKRVNPTLGGMLSGLPLGAGLSVYFISYSEGVEFIIKGIPWGIAGLAASILFCFFYLLGAKLAGNRNKAISILISSILGFAVFFISGYIIHGFNLELYSAISIFAIVFIINIAVVGKIKVHPSVKAHKKFSNPIVSVLVRGIIVGIIIVFITGIASVIGSKWTGILSSFPSTLYALILVLHHEEGNNLYPSVIRGFSYGVSTLVVFYILCRYLLPMLGLNLGFFTVYILSLVYLYLFNKIKNCLKQ